MTQACSLAWWVRIANPFAYRLRVTNGSGERLIDDPYSFGSVLGDLDLYLHAEGSDLRGYAKMGAHPQVMDGVAGTSFAVWAPNARRVSVVGDFNAWDGRRHPMRAASGRGHLGDLLAGCWSRRALQIRNQSAGRFDPAQSGSLCVRGRTSSPDSVGRLCRCAVAGTSARLRMVRASTGEGRCRSTKSIWARGAVCRRKGIAR